MIAADEAGGAIVTWVDYRSGEYPDIYVQHVLASGAVDPAWPADGRALCSAASHQYAPTIVADGAGGAIVAWQDYRSGTNYDIYVQHVLASGVVDPAWPADGRSLCTAANQQYSPTMIADGTGGAIVTWWDYRNGVDSDIYAQHVLASGAVDPAWPADGRALCTAASDQQRPTIVADGASGAIVTWHDSRSGTDADIYAQHVLASGTVDPAWPANGRALCTARNSQLVPTIVADGTGGAIVAWEDWRSEADYDIYAQHVLASGAVDPAWPANGRALCTATKGQEFPTVVADGVGGAIVTWHDSRSGTTYDIYVQHVLASGVVDPAWPADGCALCTAANGQEYPTLVTDGVGGAIVTWRDYRSGTTYDIYAQRVLASGVVDSAWPANGRALCAAANQQDLPTIVADGAGGAIVTWHDFRSGSWDIYAQRVLANGQLGGDAPVPAMLSLASVDVALDHISLAWFAGPGGAASAAVYRSFAGSVWTRIGEAATDGTGYLRFTDSEVPEATRVGYRLGIVEGGVEGFYGETWVNLPASDGPLAFALEPVLPNPTRGGALKVHFSLPTDAPARLELLDVAGRRITTRDAGSLGAGQHTLDLGAGQHLAPGLYLVRLKQGASMRTTRAVVLQ